MTEEQLKRGKEIEDKLKEFKKDLEYLSTPDKYRLRLNAVWKGTGFISKTFFDEQAMDLATHFLRSKIEKEIKELEEELAKL